MHPKDIDIKMHFRYEAWCVNKERCVKWEINRPGCEGFKLEAVVAITEDFLRVFKGIGDSFPKKKHLDMT
jgi:hypothetical protein